MMIRVRFAPSPTGFLHIGNARAALINWLFARRHVLDGHKAAFMLRLDDTDLERSEEQFEKAIYEDLAWLGLTHDQFAKQSDRFDRYREIMQKLIEADRLYACYETPEELDYKRKRQLSRGEPPIYDRAALKLTQDQIRAFEAEGRHPHWRFKLTPQKIHWFDLIRGDCDFQGEHLSDPVLVRADGQFLYTITSVIDDVDFEISHIIRGEDHVTNSAVQIQLFEALGRDPSTLHFGHTSLLLDAAGGPLSKRLGSLSLGNLREDGVEPMAINSLLARLGTSLPIEPQLTLDDLARDFDLSIFSRTPPRFDPEDLKALNQKLFQIMPFREIQRRIKTEKMTDDIWTIIRGNIHDLKEITLWEAICFGTITPIISDQDYLQQALDNLPSDPWDETTWGTWTTKLKEITERKGKELYRPLRLALTGLEHGPEMKQLLPRIGSQKVKLRLMGGS